MIAAIEELAQAYSAFLAKTASKVQTIRADQPADSHDVAVNTAGSGSQVTAIM